MSKEMRIFASLKEQKVRTMEEQIISLQKTIETLSASVASLSKANTEQAENNRKLVAEVKNLTAQIAWLKRKLFGQTSEKKVSIRQTPSCKCHEVFSENHGDFQRYL